MNQLLLQRQKKILLLVLAIGILGGAFFFFRQPAAEPLILYGNVDIRQVSLTFNASERIESLTAEEGDRVQKGDILGSLNRERLRLDVAHSQAQVAQQEAAVLKLHNGSRPEEIIETDAAVRSAQADADNAEANYRRMLALYNADAVSKQEMDNAEAAYKAADAALQNAVAAHQMTTIGPRYEDIAAAEAQLQTLRESLKIAEYNLEQATLIAPQDGVIRSRLLEPGDMASPSAPVYILSLDTPKWIRAYVAEDRLGELYEGKPAKVTIDSFPNQPLDGQVGYISDTAEFTPKSVQTTELRTALLYEVRIYVEDKDNVLRLGMPATVSF